jgi:hypothetical protein
MAAEPNEPVAPVPRPPAPVELERNQVFVIRCLEKAAIAKA